MQILSSLKLLNATLALLETEKNKECDSPHCGYLERCAQYVCADGSLCVGQLDRRVGASPEVGYTMYRSPQVCFPVI